MTKPFSCALMTHVGTLGVNSKMNDLDLNVVGWFKKEPKFDLRYWDDTNTPDPKSGGITLSLEQLRALKVILNSVDLDSVTRPIEVGLQVDDNLNPTNSNLRELRAQALKNREGKSSQVNSTVLPWDM